MISKITAILLFLDMLGVHVIASQITLDDKHVLICIEYVTEDFVPAPFRGEWKQLYYDPEKGSVAKGSAVSYDFSPGENNDYVIHQKISSHDTHAILQFVKPRDDWSFGYYSAKQRKDIVEGKYLLDYDKKLPDPPKGILPQDIKIEKHVISFENKDKIYLVIYSSKNLDLIKRYHRMPIFHQWGKPEGFWYQSIGIR